MRVVNIYERGYRCKPIPIETCESSRSSMPSEFQAVEAYLSHFDKHSETDTMLTYYSGSDMNADQKVPQISSLPLLDEDMMFCDIKQEPDNGSNIFKLTDPFSFSGDVKLAPVGSMNCTPVEVVNDQQLIGEQSPIQLLDLDHVNNEDVTFYPDTIPSVHIKQELPDIPSGCTEYGFETQPQDSYSMYGEPNQLEIMETFVINQVRKDIDTACATLGISPDPSEWTADQTQCWVRWTLQQYQLSVLDTCMFLIPGSTLCHFTETDFRMRSMESGSTLYSQLEIWKNARLYNQTSAAQIKPEMIQENAYMSFQDAIPHPAPAISPSPSLSPAPSTCSLDSLSSSSTSSIGFSSSNKTTTFDFLSTTFKSEPGLEKPIRSGTTEHKQTIHLWQFLKELLLQGQCHGNCIKWLDREKGIFKIEDSSRVARLWGKRKNRPAMNYDKLSRSIRQYYKKGIIKKTEHSKRLVYQFCKPYLS